MTPYKKAPKDHFDLIQDMGWKKIRVCYCHGSWKETWTNPQREGMELITRPTRNQYRFEKFKLMIEKGKIVSLINSKHL